MTDKTRIKIAAAVTALFLAGISTVGLAARSDSPQKTADRMRPPRPSSHLRLPGVASSMPSSTEDEGDENEAESSSDKQEGYYGERDDHD